MRTCTCGFDWLVIMKSDFTTSGADTRRDFSTRPRKLLDQLTSILRAKHHSYRTEQARIFPGCKGPGCGGLFCSTTNAILVKWGPSRLNSLGAGCHCWASHGGSKTCPAVGITREDCHPKRSSVIIRVYLSSSLIGNACNISTNVAKSTS